MSKRKIAISDIHGCCKAFKALLKQIDLSTDDELYLLGDYVDRGADSKGVIDHIWALQESGHTVHCLMGNHEHMMIKAADEERRLKHWMKNGAQTTLDSFGVDKIEDVPDKYIDWMKNLDLFFKVDDYYLVHAGFNFKKEDPLEERYDMIWIRDWYDDIDEDWLDGATIIHGHTIIEKSQIIEMLENIETNKVLDIDNGCFAVQGKDRGRLCAFDMTNKKLHFYDNLGLLRFFPF